MNVTLKDLLDAGVHFGHQTKRWNPRSKGFVFDHRQGISIIDLTITHEALEKACKFVENKVAEGGNVLLVGTKRQAQEIIREAAAMTNMPFCANRWMGGTLTNFQTIKRSIAKYKRYQEMETSGAMAKLPKKEESAIKREMARMNRNFEGLVDMPDMPSIMFVVDVNYEDIAVAEANRIKVPVVAIVDTNSDPTPVDYPIPGNDDAVKSIRIVVECLVEAIQAGLSQRESRRVSAGMQDVRNLTVQQFAVGTVPAGQRELIRPSEAAASVEEDETAEAEDEIAVIEEPDDVVDFEEEEVVVAKKPKAVKPKKVIDEDEVEADEKA
ncbi:MAG: 30S ribosomal protein S2 [Opitutaceae bacterium]